MPRKDQLRVDLDDRKLPCDRRLNQVKGDIDVSGLDSEDVAALREEDITNLNPDELDRLEAEMGITRGTEEERRDLVPERRLHKDLEDEEGRLRGDATPGWKRRDVEDRRQTAGGTPRPRAKGQAKVNQKT